MTGKTPSQDKFAASDKFLREAAVIARFLDERGDESFTDLYELFTPRLVAFYRARMTAIRGSRKTSHSS